jgi:hypothetical protein
MSNALAPLPPPPEPPAVRPSLMRFVADRNPFFLLSAVSMFAGVRVILSALNVSPGDVWRLLLLIGALNAYEAAVIALALYLITRRNQRRDGWILLSIEALFLVDLTNLNSEVFTASLRWGMAVNAVCWMLAVVKVAVVVRTLRLRMTKPEWAYVALQLAAVFFLAGALKQISRHGRPEGSVSALTLYGAWWLAGAILVLATLLLRRPHERQVDASAMSPLPGRLYLALPYFALLVHLAGANRVYWVHFHPANVAPVLLGLAVLMTRWRGSFGRSFLVGSQAALAALAIIISLPYPGELVAAIGSQPLSPLRLALIGSAGVMALSYFVSGHLIAAQFAAASLVAAGLGNSPVEMQHHSLGMAKYTYAWLKRLVPQTPLQWGVVAVAGSFVMLGLGAVVSLRKHPAAEHSSVLLERPPD